MRMRRLLLALAIVAASLVVLLGAPPADAQPQLNATWTQKPGIPAPPVGPEPRGWVRVFYDTLNHKMVLMYGSAGHYMNDVWQYDTPGNAWTKIEPYIDCAFLNDFFPATRRDEQVTEYDSFNHLYWMFGGNGYQCAWTHRTAQAGTTTLRVVDPGLTESTPNFYKDWTVEANGKLAYVTNYDAVAKVLNLATPIATLAPGVTYKVYPSPRAARGTTTRPRATGAASTAPTGATRAPSRSSVSPRRWRTRRTSARW